MASEGDAAANAFTDLPAGCLRGIVQCLWADARDAAAFACCCRTTNSLLDDQMLWRELLLRRYGERVIPGMRPTPEQTRAAELQGFVFYQGQDGSEDSDEERAGADLAQLVKLAQDAGVEAFTTSGKLIKCLKPQAHWRHSSFKPSDGMYVRQLAVQYRQLQEPQPAHDLADDSWPPSVPGWVYFPSCVSAGHHKAGPVDSLTRYQTLQALLHAASQRHDIVAVTTEGETKTKLRPQACWEVHPSYDVGLYVRAPVAQQMRLVPSPAVPDYHKLCSKLQQLRLDAAHMSCAWLNDRYLSLQEMDDSPAYSGMALVLNDVWWLDVGGSIPGVPPGCYEVAWVVDVSVAYLEDATISLSAEAIPVHPKQQQQQAQQQQAPAAAEPAAATATASSSASTAATGAAGPDVGADVQQNKVLVEQRWRPDLQRLQQLCQAQRAAWGVVSGGLLHVSDYSTVQLRFWCTDNTYKRAMRWAMVELIPVGTQQQQQPQVQQAAQRNRVWRPAAGRTHGQEGGVPSSGTAAAGEGGGMMAWLERMFGPHFK